jgi:hypothetical protein
VIGPTFEIDLESEMSAVFFAGTLVDETDSQSVEQQPGAATEVLPLLSGLQQE